MESNYNYYNKFGGNYLRKFLDRNSEFDCDEFREYIAGHNRGSRDSGELQDIAKHEVLRVAAEWMEKLWRFPNVYGEPTE